MEHRFSVFVFVGGMHPRCHRERRRIKPAYGRKHTEKSPSAQLLVIVVLGMLVATSWSWLPRWASPERLERWGRKRWLGRLLAGDPLRRLEWAHRAVMTLCAGFGIWAFTLFGQMHDHGAFGHQNFHAHDCFHYYFGSKYLKEWGYDRMHLAEERERPDAKAGAQGHDRAVRPFQAAKGVAREKAS